MKNNLIKAWAVFSFTTLMAVTASAESAFVQKTQTPMPVTTYIPFNGAVDLNSSHLLKRGIANYSEGNYTTAAMLLHRTLRTNPSDGFANYYMGLTKAKIGNDRGSLKYLRRANQVFKNVPQSYAALGLAYAKTGQIDKARRVLARLETVKTCNINCASRADVDAARLVIKQALGQ